jgi:glyoxylase-like metal-dependent hydrolase (beta-lactamase superfamily II)
MSDGAIPFRKQMEFEYGVADTVTPLVRRIVAPNPSGFTFHGTNTYIVGHGRVAVIDPGPLLDDHLDAIVKELEGETVEHIVVTHTHHDHSPAAAPLRDRVGGIIWGAHPRPIPEGVRTAESIQRDFAPNRELANGTRVVGEDWSLESVHTPGHMSNHMCFALPEENILFSGDHIMSWNTTVVSPPVVFGQFLKLYDAYTNTCRRRCTGPLPARSSRIWNTWSKPTGSVAKAPRGRIASSACSNA